MLQRNELFWMSTTRDYLLLLERECRVLNMGTQGLYLAPPVKLETCWVLNWRTQSATKPPTASTPLAPQVKPLFLLSNEDTYLGFY